MTQADFEYHALLDKVLSEGVEKEDRTGTGTFSLFGHQMRFDARDYEIPLLTTKEIKFNGVKHELLWFLQGKENMRYLVQNGVNIWNDWPYEKYVKACEEAGDDPLTMKAWAAKVRDNEDFAKIWGEVGPMYGCQWVNWDPKSESGPINQLQGSIDMLISNKDSRRNIVTAWNPTDIHRMSLPPCHVLYQFYSSPMKEAERNNQFVQYAKLHNLEITGMSVSEAMDHYEFPDRWLSVLFYMRSVDIFLGMPFDIGTFSILLHMMGQVTGHAPREVILSSGDTHLYRNHVDQAKEQLSRRGYDASPQLRLNRDVKDLFAFTGDDVELVNYQHEGFIKAPISV